MFLFNFLPFPVRAQPAPFLWIFYKALHDLGAEAVHLVSEDYTTAPSEHRAAARQELDLAFAQRMQYGLPSDEAVAAARTRIIPQPLLAAIGERHRGNMKALFQAYLSEPIPELQAWFEAAIAELAAGPEPIEAIFTWCNCPSLSVVAAARRIALIHCEQGPLRAPEYLATAYFDHTGVNGGTESAQRYADPANDLDWPCFDLDALRSLLRVAPAIEPAAGRADRVGVALQVEVDSNVIAFGRGEDAQSLINRVAAIEVRRTLLVRSHPLSQFRYQGPLASHDPALPIEDFLSQVSHVWTINSSVATEAVLAGISASCLGDCSHELICGPAAGKEFARRCTFYFLAYLVPYRLLFKPDYIRFRLHRPTEAVLAACHLTEYVQQRNQLEQTARMAQAEQAAQMEKRLAARLHELEVARENDRAVYNQQALIGEACQQQLRADCEQWRTSAEQLRTERDLALADHELDRNQLRALLNLTEARLAAVRERLVRATASRNHYRSKWRQLDQSGAGQDGAFRAPDAARGAEPLPAAPPPPPEATGSSSVTMAVHEPIVPPEGEPRPADVDGA